MTISYILNLIFMKGSSKEFIQNASFGNLLRGHRTLASHFLYEPKGVVSDLKLVGNFMKIPRTVGVWPRAYIL